MLFRSTAGVGDTPEEAWQLFRKMLQQLYAAYLDGQLSGYEESGKPARSQLTMTVHSVTREQLEGMAKTFGCSEGEVIDYLVGFHEVAVLPRKPDKPAASAKATQSD